MGAQEQATTAAWTKVSDPLPPVTRSATVVAGTRATVQTTATVDWDVKNEFGV